MAKGKKEALPPVERLAFEEALKGYVADNSEYTRLATRRDERVRVIDAEYDTTFAQLKVNMDNNRAIVERYCNENRKTMFTEKKSMEVFGAKIGFRYDPPAVVTLKGFTFKGIADKFKKLKNWKQYVRITVSLNKEAILADRPKGMEKHGLSVEQEEHFVLDVDKTEVDA